MYSSLILFSLPKTAYRIDEIGETSNPRNQITENIERIGVFDSATFEYDEYR